MLKSLYFDVKTEVGPSRVTGSDCDCYTTDESQDLTENCPETHATQKPAIFVLYTNNVVLFKCWVLFENVFEPLQCFADDM